MAHLEKALESASTYLAKIQQKTGEPLDIIKFEIIEKDFGWVFF